MFRGYEVLDEAAFRVTRNSNLYMQEEESRSVLESVREELHNRRKGDAVRLEIEKLGQRRDGPPACVPTSSWTSGRSSRPMARSTSRG